MAGRSRHEEMNIFQVIRKSLILAAFRSDPDELMSAMDQPPVFRPSFTALSPARSIAPL